VGRAAQGLYLAGDAFTTVDPFGKNAVINVLGEFEKLFLNLLDQFPRRGNYEALYLRLSGVYHTEEMTVA